MLKIKFSDKKNIKIIALSLAVLAVIVLVNVVNSSGLFTIPAAAPNIRGIGVLGDSNADEYRADDNRGGSYVSTTRNWVEQLANYRGLNFGVWSTWGGPRRAGYKYNWARSGATSATLLGEGQHTGLAAQISSGEVTVVFVAIGANDYAYYNDVYGRIYNGTLVGTALESYINSVANNVTVAIDAVRQPNKAKILVATIPNSGLSPEAIAQFPDAAKRQRVTNALAKTNEKIKAAAASRGLPIFDSEMLTTKLLSRVDARGFVTIAGEKINFAVAGDEPRHALLGDRIHAGTVFSGIYANEWMDAMNKTLGTELRLFTEEELLVHAGIRTSLSPTVRPTASPIITPAPTPTTDPLAQHCGRYRSFRSLLLRFLSPVQIAEWDFRCGV